MPYLNMGSMSIILVATWEPMIQALRRRACVANAAFVMAVDF